MGQGTEVGRNDPCPCGSGKKYKQCHLGQDETSPQAGADAVRSDSRVTGAIAIAGAVLGVVIGMSQGADIGIAVGGGIVLAVGAWVIFRNPPPPKQGGDDPAAINFGG